MSGWEIASLTELESFAGPGTLRWAPVRRHFGITAFGTNAYTATEAGQDVVEAHTEEGLGHEEMYVVVSGRATFVLDGEEVDVPAGSVVYLGDPGVRRYARAEEPGTTVLAVGGKPGTHDVSAWEAFFLAYALADADSENGLERAIAELEAALADQPDHPGLNYHLACMLSRSGRLDEGRARLERALEAAPELRERAEQDEDLAPLGITRET